MASICLGEGFTSLEDINDVPLLDSMSYFISNTESFNGPACINLQRSSFISSLCDCIGHIDVNASSRMWRDTERCLAIRSGLREN